MDAVLIVAIIFGSITIWVRGFPRLLSGGAQDEPRSRRSRRRARPALGDGDTDDERARLAADHERRLQTLESVVSNVDYELNKKLSRLATQQLARQPSAGAERPLTTARDRGRDHTANARAREDTPSGGALAVGARIADRFVIETLIGSGAMGEVYRALDETLEETVALKVMGGLSLLDPGAVDRFKREAVAARRITHPNVVRLHDIGIDRGVHYLSMEHVRGESLAERLVREKALALPDVRDIAGQVCDALEAAHTAGVVHRDLKPGNILLDDSGKVRVIDFGVARLAGASGMTATGLVLGTPEYMAPEQIQGETLDARADLYSLGSIIFHMLAGSPPYGGASPMAVALAHCTATIPPLDEYRDLPKAWITLVERALAKAPDERFQSAQEMRSALPG